MSSGAEPEVRSRRYSRRIFVFPPWREIYATDAERWESFSRMPAVFDNVQRTLRELGYDPVTVPIGSLEERAAFVLDRAV